MSSSSTSDLRPTAKQLRYLRNLAVERGVSFCSPSTRAQASFEIKRLLRMGRDSHSDRRYERKQVSRDMANIGDAASIRDNEIVGYGSSARWLVSER